MTKLGCVLLIGLFSTVALAQDAQTVTVVGEVLRPGKFDIPPSGLTVLQAVAMSGGLRETANPEIEIVRRTNREEVNYRINGKDIRLRVVERIRVNLKDVLAGKATNISLEAGDS